MDTKCQRTYNNLKVKKNGKIEKLNSLIMIKSLYKRTIRIKKWLLRFAPTPLHSPRTSSGHITQYMRFTRCTSFSHILLRFTPQNIAYTWTLYYIYFLTEIQQFTDNHQKQKLFGGEKNKDFNFLMKILCKFLDWKFEKNDYIKFDI